MSRKEELLAAIKSTQDPMLWSIPDTDIVVEFPKGPLDGSWDKIKKLKLNMEIFWLLELRI